MKISIITVVYNNEKYIKDSIESVIHQTYKNIEYIIVDGGSTDNTLNTISRYKSEIQILVSEPDKGIYDALNKGIALATGDVIGILHSDDVFNASTTIAEIAENFIAHNINALYGDLLYVNKDEPHKIIRFWKSKEFKSSMLKAGWMPPHPTLFLKRELIDEVGKYELQYKIAADYDFMIRTFLNKSIKPYYLPQVITRMRLGGASNRNIRNILNKSLEDLKIIRSNHIGGIYTLMLKNLSKIKQFV